MPAPRRRRFGAESPFPIIRGTELQACGGSPEFQRVPMDKAAIFWWCLFVQYSDGNRFKVFSINPSTRINPIPPRNIRRRRFGSESPFPIIRGTELQACGGSPKFQRVPMDKDAIFWWCLFVQYSDGNRFKVFSINPSTPIKSF